MRRLCFVLALIFVGLIVAAFAGVADKRNHHGVWPEGPQSGWHGWA